MGSTQGEIRVGPSHQAKLPQNRANINPSELTPDEEFLKEREEVRWIPSVAMDGDLVMFLRAARSMAAFAGMCDGGSAEDGVIAATRDETTLNALDVLHDCGYDKSKALQTLVKCPVPKSVEKRWAEEETKRFVKGLRQFGKNFFRIKKDLLPHKETPELVEFYYLWKKTPGANNNRPHRRRRQGSLRRNRNTRNTRGGAQKEEVAGNPRPSPGSKDQGDASSGSDEDNDNSYDDSDSRENGGYRCQNCFTTSSRDWIHASNGPKQGLLLCNSCHTYYKQCGELPQTTKAEPYLFQPVQTDSPEGSPGRMRTRNKTKETPTKEKSKSKRSEMTTPEPEVEKKSDSKSSASKLKKSKTDTTPNRKRTAPSPGEGEVKRKKERGPDSASEESDLESLADEIDATVSSPLQPQNIDEKPPKSDDTVADVVPSLLNLEENVEVKVETNELSADTSEVPFDHTTDKMVPDTNESLVNDDFVMPDVPHPSPKPFDYADGTLPIKNENVDERDEILPPILTSEESYVPKDEMPTLHANTCLTETIVYPPPHAETSAVKTEPPEDNSASDSQKSNELEPTPRHPPSPYSNRSVSPNAVMAYGRIPVETSRAETETSKTASGPSLLMSRYPVYGTVEDEKNEKAVGSSELTPISLALPHQAAPFSPYYHFQPHIPPHVDRNNDNSLYLSEPPLQMEPQDLKIKQEVVPLDQPPPSLAIDPLQSLKEVKVPGYSNIPISQPLLTTSSANPPSLNAADLRSMTNRSEGNSPFATNAPIDEIKKESESYSSSTRVATPAKSPAKISSDMIARSVALSPKLSHSPPYTPFTSQASNSRTPISSPANTNASAPQPSPLNQAAPAHLAPHPHAYMPPLHPHQQAAAAAAAYYQHPLFAQVAHAAAMHQFPHPHYPGYPYGFPYPTPYPIPQPIPPPRPAENQKRDGERSTTLVTSHHSSSSSSSVTTRSLRDEDSNVHAQEITQTHHHSSSHHASIHHHNEKQTISHSSSSSSSASVQHKVKRSSSPQHSSSTCHVSATLSQSTSSSVSTNHGQSMHHSHHHQHTHHHQSGESPSQLINMSMPLAPNKSHPASMLTGPPVLPPAHHPALSITGLQPSATGSLEALRAHAHAIHSPLLPPSSQGLPDEDDILSPTNYVPKGPSPEPKIEDSECHRSQSAIFLRHWNRGDYNSCARTDLTFKPVPDSKLDKKRQERSRKQAEKEREEREKSQTRKIVTPDKPESVKPPSRGPIESITSPYDRFARGTPYGDSTPALRQLSEYARPHTGFSPVGLPRSAASLALPPQCIDPMLHYQLNMYGPSPRERLEMEHFEREKRDRELRELREERLKEEMIKSAGTRLPNPMDPHWMDLRRFNALTSGAPSGLHPFSLYAGAAGQPGTLSPLERERLERLASSAGPYQRSGLIPGREAALGLHPPPDLLARPYADQLAHQAAAHEHMQRQMLLERERYPHPALVAAQQEEYLRKLSLGNSLM